MTKMRALGGMAVHTGTSPNVSPDAGTHQEDAGPNFEPAPECARTDGAYMVHCSCFQLACANVPSGCASFIHSPRPLGHWLDALKHNAQVLRRHHVPDVLYDLFTARNEVPDSQNHMSISSSFAAQIHILRMCRVQLADRGGAETTMRKTHSFLEKVQRHACLMQCIVLSLCSAPASIWRLLSTELYIETSHYETCFSTLYPLMSYSVCLRAAPRQTMPVFGCSAAFTLILPVHVPGVFVHGMQRPTCTLHAWRLWRFKRPQHRRPLRHRRAGSALAPAGLRRRLCLHCNNPSFFQPAVPSNIVTTWIAHTAKPTPPIHTGRLGPKSEASRHIQHALYGGSVCSFFRLLCIAA